MSTTNNNVSPIIVSPVTDSAIGQGSYTLHDSKLGGHGVYFGIVKEVNLTTRRLTVFINDQLVYNCIYAAGTIAGLLGFSSTQLPQVESTVLCLVTEDTTWVIGSQPIHVKNTETWSGAIAAGVSKYSQIGDEDFNRSFRESEQHIIPGYPMSRDLLPGEEEISNNIGVALRLLTNFAQLDSGGLAKIECHLLNDMVRIVDAYFAHHHCGGDTLIWDNGRNNEEAHFTSYPHEAAGKKKEEEIYAEPVGEWQAQDICKEAGPDPKVWRKSSYLGFLGDMLHYWITHPKIVKDVTGEKIKRASRVKTWVGADGTVTVQAAGDVLIQVSQTMCMPDINFKWDDPTYNPKEALKNLNIEFLKIWGEGDQHWIDLSVSCWQMRYYLKYLTVWHSLERFRQLQDSGYCTILPEAQCTVGNTDCGEKDKKKAGCTTPSTAQQCCLHLSPAGTISLVAGNDTSVIMEHGNIQLAAPNNIEIKAGGTLSVSAKDVSIKSYRIFEIISLAGSIAIKARTSLKALCERGRIWIKGDAPKNEKELSNSILPTEFSKYSVVIDSSRGDTLIHGKKGVTVGASGEKGDIHIQASKSKGSVRIYASNNIYTYSKALFMRAFDALGIFSPSIKIEGRLMKIYQNFLLSAKELLFNGHIKGNYIASPNMIYALAGFMTKEKPHLGTANNDKDILQQLTDICTINVENKDLDKIGALAKDMKQAEVTIDFEGLEFKAKYGTWRYEDWKNLVNNETVQHPSSLKAEPFTEGKYHRLILPYHFGLRHKTVAKLKPGPRTSTTRLPYPGTNSKTFVFSRKELGDTFTVPLAKDFERQDICTINDMKKIDTRYYFKAQ